MSEPGDRPYLPCEEILGFLWAYLDGELPPPTVAEFERHLAVCPSCVAYIATYQQTIELGRGTARAGDEAAADLPEELVQAVLAARCAAP